MLKRSVRLRQYNMLKMWILSNALEMTFAFAVLMLVLQAWAITMLGMSTEPETFQTIVIIIGTAACCFAVGIFCGVSMINERYYIWQNEMLDLLHRVNAQKTASLFTDEHGKRPKHLN